MCAIRVRDESGEVLSHPGHSLGTMFGSRIEVSFHPPLPWLKAVARCFFVKAEIEPGRLVMAPRSIRIVRFPPSNSERNSVAPAANEKAPASDQGLKN